MVGVEEVLGKGREGFRGEGERGRRLGESSWRGRWGREWKWRGGWVWGLGWWEILWGEVNDMLCVLGVGFGGLVGWAGVMGEGGVLSVALLLPQEKLLESVHGAPLTFA